MDNEKEEHQHIIHRLWGNRTLGQKIADGVTRKAGSWGFIISFIIFIIAWITLNIVAIARAWDPYPFILLNLGLSMLAALQAPIILMSQNRENERDRHRAILDYHVNKKAEEEIEDMQKDLEEIKTILKNKCQ